MPNTSSKTNNSTNNSMKTKNNNSNNKNTNTNNKNTDINYLCMPNRDIYKQLSNDHTFLTMPAVELSQTIYSGPIYLPGLGYMIS